MKARTFVLVILFCVAVSLSFAVDKISIDDVFGTWVNSDYNDELWKAGKKVTNPDGTDLAYGKETDTEPAWKTEFTIIDSWHDKEGNLFVKGTFVIKEENKSGYYLDKLSNAGKVKETVWSQADYPDEVSPIGGIYEIYYRQE